MSARTARRRRMRRIAIAVCALLSSAVTVSYVLAASPSTVVDGYRVDVRVIGAGEVVQAERRCPASPRGTACRWSQGTGLLGRSIRFQSVDTAAGWRFSSWSGCPDPAGRTCVAGLPGLWRNGAIQIVARFERTGVVIAGGPGDDAVVPSHDATFAFSTVGPVAGPVAYRCALDKRRFEPCGSDGVGYTLSDGRHRLRVQGRDPWGVVGSASRAWTVDTRAPAAAITAAPPAADNHAVARFRFAASDASRVSWRCRVIGGDIGRLPPFRRCRSGIRYRLSAGAQTFQAQAIDGAGNASDVVTHRWVVDLTPPRIAIAAAPRPVSRSRSARFLFGAADAVTVRCALDRRWMPCPSMTSASYRGLADGPHTFAVRGWDAAGNEATVEHSWRVDTVASKRRSDASAGHPAAAIASGLVRERAGHQARTHQGSLALMGAHGGRRRQQAVQLAPRDSMGEARRRRHGEGVIGHGPHRLLTGLQRVCNRSTALFSGTPTGVACA